MRTPNQSWALEFGPGEIRATAGPPPESAHHGPMPRASAGAGQDRHALLAVPLTEGEYELTWPTRELAARETERLIAEQERRPRPRDYSNMMRASLPLSDDGYDLLFGRAG